MLRFYTIILFFVLYITNSRAQSSEILEVYQPTQDSVLLEELLLLKKPKFKDGYSYKKYRILRRKTRKVYPYAVRAATHYKKLNDSLASIDNKRREKKYIKQLQKYLENEFTEELKKLTRTEGQILVKLVYRQTGISFFDLIKNYRSSWKAFWYQRMAKWFDISLKSTYIPSEDQIDYWIEGILQHSFQEEILVEQEPAIDIQFHALQKQWGRQVDYGSPPLKEKEKKADLHRLKINPTRDTIVKQEKNMKS